MTFFDWLQRQRARSDSIGRLALEVSRDKTFPRQVRRLHLLLHYYDSEPKNRRAVKEAHREWRNEHE